MPGFRWHRELPSAVGPCFVTVIHVVPSTFLGCRRKRMVFVCCFFPSFCRWSRLSSTDGDVDRSSASVAQYSAQIQPPQNVLTLVPQERLVCLLCFLARTQLTPWLVLQDGERHHCESEQPLRCQTRMAAFCVVFCGYRVFRMMATARCLSVIHQRTSKPLRRELSVTPSADSKQRCTSLNSLTHQ